MRRRKRRAVLFIIGFAMCVFPLIENIKAGRSHVKVLSIYDKNSREMEKRFSLLKKDAEKYNDMLFQSQGALVDGMRNGILSDKNYEKLLNISDTGVMGSLDIPKINVKLPIYHGTGEEALSGGVGHLKGSSLPVGGENTHCILTGHRGLPSARLLVRLDEIKTGDLIYVHVGGDILAYKVSKSIVTEPEDTSCLKIVPEKDRLSVVTCTPYGINTQRLIVTADRVKYEKSEHDGIRPAIPSPREIIFAVCPFVFAVLFIVMSIRERRRRYYEKRYYY